MTEGPARPKIVLPGVGLVDPNAQPPAPEEPAPLEEIPVAENVIYDEPSPETAEEATVAAHAPEAPAESLDYQHYYEQPAEADVDAAAVAEAEAEPVEEFLSTPVEAEEPTRESVKSPELRAAPAELKELAPRRLGPPPGWRSVAEVPAMEAAPVPPAAVWEEPVEFAPETTPEEVETQAHYTPYAEPAEEAAGPVPVAIPVRSLANRLPTPLTSPHSDRPAIRRVTHQVRPTTGPAPHLHTAAPAPQGQATQSLPARPGAAQVAAAQRLLPAWVLVVIGLLTGAVAAIVAVAKSPLRDKIGLMERSQANAYVLAVLKEERKQVQAMLDTYYRNAKISLPEEMAEFRTEEGRKAPEKMTLQEFTAEMKEQEAIKKEEEAEDKKAAEEEAKAAKEAEEEKAKPADQ